MSCHHMNICHKERYNFSTLLIRGADVGVDKRSGRLEGRAYLALADRQTRQRIGGRREAHHHVILYCSYQLIGRDETNQGKWDRE